MGKADDDYDGVVYFTTLSVPIHDRIIFLALQPNSGLGRLIVEVSRSHAIRHAHPLARLWKSDHLVAEAATYTTHNKHKRRTAVPSAEFEPGNPAIKLATDLRLRAHRHPYRLCGIINAWWIGGKLEGSNCGCMYVVIPTFTYRDYRNTRKTQNGLWFYPSCIQCTFLMDDRRVTATPACSE
jgi:hypothetical protein